MKTFVVVLILLVGAVVALGFYLSWFHLTVNREKINRDTAKAQEKLREAETRIRGDTGPAGETVREKTEATESGGRSTEKEEYQKKVRADLDDLGRKMDELKAKAEKSGSPSGAEISQKMDELKRNADQRFQDVRAASADHWDEAKHKMDTTLERLKKEYEEARSRLR